MSLTTSEARALVERFLRECHKNKPPSKRDLRGRTEEEDIAIGIDEFMANPADVRAISIIMNNEKTDELPGKVASLRKVLAGSD